MQELLLFPQQLQRLRIERASSQKAFAIEVGLDQAFFCGVEKGRRPPFSAEQIHRLAQFLTLPRDEVDALSWAATHDTCIRFVWRATGSGEQTLLVSRLLCTARSLTSVQRQGLAAYLESVGSSANQLVTLAKLGTTGDDV